jgi:type IV pilus assembly protein PilX
MTTPNPPPADVRRPERGMALVCALMLMLAAMVIGVAVARGAFVLLAAARNERDRAVAQAAAEAALRDAEHDIAGTAAAPPGRAAHFAPAGAADFADGCGRGADDRGLCRATSPPAWQTLDLADEESAVIVPYGSFTGALLAVGRGMLPARLPAYVIERVAPAGAAAEQGTFYRITAIGFGTRTATRVVLQSLYRLPPPEPAADGGGSGAGNGGGNENGVDNGNNNGDQHGNGNDNAGGGGGGGRGAGDGGDGNGSGNGNGNGANNGSGSGSGTDNGNPAPAQPQRRQFPAGRIGWREIANWTELHARAQP